MGWWRKLKKVLEEMEEREIEIEREKKKQKNKNKTSVRISHELEKKGVSMR